MDEVSTFGCEIMKGDLYPSSTDSCLPSEVVGTVAKSIVESGDLVEMADFRLWPLVEMWDLAAFILAVLSITLQASR